MKKNLIFSACNDFNALEFAIERLEAGEEVHLIQCDKVLGICQHNKKGSCLMCRHCHESMISVIKDYPILKKASIINLSDIVNDKDKSMAREFKVEFSTIQELKDLTFSGAQVGYGAFSSYVTFTRNVMPDITDEFKKYISYYVEKEVMVYSALERLCKENKFDQIVFHNGRFAQFKPFLEFAKIHGIDYVTTEHKMYNNKLLKDIFFNDIPHALDYLAQNVLKNWENGDPSTREEIGRSFYEKRKKGITAGDKVFVKDQIVGAMPDGWDNSVENISIFNSSEDEFCAVSKDYDSYLMFPNQYVALKTIFDHYKGDKTKHFYVRIHPNLKNVPFKSHLALHELKYDNVTIIPANSPISSYTLLDNSDKIIIFDSTMGVEAAYWKKPVIALTKYIYWKLNLLYTPNTPEEVWQLIDDKNLKAKEQDEVNLIKYGYWLLHPNYPEVSKIRYVYENFKFLGRQFSDYTTMKLLGSYKLHIIFEYLANKLNLFSKFKKLPCTEPYKING